MLGNRERLLALTVFLVVLALVADRLLLTPLLATWRQDGEKVIQLRAELAETESLRESLPSWRQERERRRDLAFPAVRTETENETLKAVATYAVGRGLQLKGIRPAWREPGSTEKGSPAQLELAVSASGSLTSVAGFLYDLETMPGPIRADRTRLHSRGEDGRGLDLDVVITVLPGTVAKEGAR